jgi:hypothetical protein
MQPLGKQRNTGASSLLEQLFSFIGCSDLNRTTVRGIDLSTHEPFLAQTLNDACHTRRTYLLCRGKTSKRCWSAEDED